MSVGAKMEFTTQNDMSNAIKSNKPILKDNEVVNKGLYDPKNEHDSCGLGFIANYKGKKSHKIIFIIDLCINVFQNTYSL